MSPLFAAGPEGFFSLAVQDSTGTPATLELHISYIGGNGQEKESHQNITRSVLRRWPPTLGTNVSVRFYTASHPHDTQIGTLAKEDYADCWRARTKFEKNKIAEWRTLSTRQNWRFDRITSGMIVHDRSYRLQP